MQLREEILPFLWRDTGLRAADYELVLQMLSRAGVLFIADESASGRRWVMPTILAREIRGDLRETSLSRLSRGTTL